MPRGPQWYGVTHSPWGANNPMAQAMSNPAWQNPSQVWGQQSQPMSGSTGGAVGALASSPWGGQSPWNPMGGPGGPPSMGPGGFGMGGGPVDPWTPMPPGWDPMAGPGGLLSMGPGGPQWGTTLPPGWQPQAPGWDPMAGPGGLLSRGPGGFGIGGGGQGVNWLGPPTMRPPGPMPPWQSFGPGAGGAGNPSHMSGAGQAWNPFGGHTMGYGNWPFGHHAGGGWPPWPLGGGGGVGGQRNNLAGRARPGARLEQMIDRDLQLAGLGQAGSFGRGLEGNYDPRRAPGVPGRRRPAPGKKPAQTSDVPASGPTSVSSPAGPPYPSRYADWG